MLAAATDGIGVGRMRDDRRYGTSPSSSGGDVDRGVENRSRQNVRLQTNTRMVKAVEQTSSQARNLALGGNVFLQSGDDDVVGIPGTVYPIAFHLLWAGCRR